MMICQQEQPTCVGLDMEGHEARNKEERKVEQGKRYRYYRSKEQVRGPRSFVDGCPKGYSECSWRGEMVP